MRILTKLRQSVPMNTLYIPWLLTNIYSPNHQCQCRKANTDAFWKWLTQGRCIPNTVLRMIKFADGHTDKHGLNKQFPLIQNMGHNKTMKCSEFRQSKILYCLPNLGAITQVTLIQMKRITPSGAFFIKPTNFLVNKPREVSYLVFSNGERTEVQR